MNRAIGATDNERRLGPGLRTYPVGQISGAHKTEEPKQRTFAFAQHHRSAADDRKLRTSRGIVQALLLFLGVDGKNTRKKTSWHKTTRCDATIVSNVAAHFEATGNLLGVITFEAAACRKVRRTAQYEIEAFIGTQGLGVAKVGVANVEPRFEPVPASRFAREPDAFFLGFDSDEACAVKPPRRNHRHRPDTAAKVQDGPCGRTPTRSVPRSQDVVRREAMALLQLKEAKITADRIERFTRLKRRPMALGAGRERPGLRPTAKCSITPVHERKYNKLAREKALFGLIVEIDATFKGLLV
jgi:hypothetical protein